MPLARQYMADIVLQNNSLTGMWTTYTMDGQVKSLDGNQYAHVLYNGT